MGDLGCGWQPDRPGKSDDSESGARTDHQRAGDRVVKGFFDHHQVDHQQSGGSPVHYGIVHYGTDPKNLNQTAKNPIRLNPSHPTTVFRVRMDNLKTRTTYYYTVESEEATGTSDRLKSAVKQFTTPGGTATSGPVK